MRQACEEAFRYGADLCYLMKDPILADYRNEPYTKGITDLVNQYRPEIILLGATTLGRDLAGRIATTLATGPTADCIELNIDLENRSLAATRPLSAAAFCARSRRSTIGHKWQPCGRE